ncbi:hypothetical protein D3C80_1217170 [compost metagenome]
MRPVAAFHVDVAAHVEVAADVDHVVPGLARAGLSATAGRHREYRLDGRGGAGSVVLVAQIGGHAVALVAGALRRCLEFDDGGVQLAVADLDADFVVDLQCVQFGRVELFEVLAKDFHSGPGTGLGVGGGMHRHMLLLGAAYRVHHAEGSGGQGQAGEQDDEDGRHAALAGGRCAETRTGHAHGQLLHDVGQADSIAQRLGAGAGQLGAAAGIENDLGVPAWLAETERGAIDVVKDL